MREFGGNCLKLSGSVAAACLQLCGVTMGSEHDIDLSRQPKIVMQMEIADLVCEKHLSYRQDCRQIQRFCTWSITSWLENRPDHYMSLYVSIAMHPYNSPT